MMMAIPSGDWIAKRTRSILLSFASGITSSVLNTHVGHWGHVMVHDGHAGQVGHEGTLGHWGHAGPSGPSGRSGGRNSVSGFQSLTSVLLSPTNLAHVVSGMPVISESYRSSMSSSICLYMFSSTVLL